MPTQTTITPDSCPPPIDLASLHDRCLGDTEFAEQLLGIFAEQAPRQLAGIAAAVAAADAPLISQLAHTLKGSAANLSAERVLAPLAKLEELGRANVLDQAQDALALLQNEMNRCMEFIHRQRAGSQAAAPVGSADGSPLPNALKSCES